MSLRTCAECSTQYAVDIATCPHCGSTNTEDAGVVTKRLPLFVKVACPVCSRGPWTVRLAAVASGLLVLPTLACASCGSQVPVTWPPEEEPVSPKITVHGGATNAHGSDDSPVESVSQPLVGAEADQGRPTSDEVQTETVEELDEVQTETDYTGMTLAELREEAVKRGIVSYGSKAQVIERLQDDDNAAPEPSE